MAIGKDILASANLVDAINYTEKKPEKQFIFWRCSSIYLVPSIAYLGQESLPFSKYRPIFTFLSYFEDRTSRLKIFDLSKINPYNPYKDIRIYNTKKDKPVKDTRKVPYWNPYTETYI